MRDRSIPSWPSLLPVAVGLLGLTVLALAFVPDYGMAVWPRQEVAWVVPKFIMALSLSGVLAGMVPSRYRVRAAECPGETETRTLHTCRHYPYCGHDQRDNLAGRCPS